MTKRNKFFLVPIVLAGTLVATVAFAQTTDSNPSSDEQRSLSTFTFPIVELGGCSTRQECKIYCDNPENKESCIAYAESHGLMTKIKADAARVIIKKLGPGGCAGAQECRAYCSDETHRAECYAFAVRHGLRSQEEANRDKNFQSALKSTGGGPGGCTKTNECKEYCSKVENIEECRSFADLHGFMRLRHELQDTNAGESRDPSLRRMSTSSKERILPLDGRDKAQILLRERPFVAPTSTSKFFDRPLPSNVRPQNQPKPDFDSSEINDEPTSYMPRTYFGAAVANFLNSLGW